MKILVFGATGLLGQALNKEAEKRNYDFVSIARHNADICLDITNDNRIEDVIKTQNPDVVINACAIVNHKSCNDNPSLAYLTNARPSSILSNLVETNKFKYVYISTDGYFNGDGTKKHSESSPVLLFNEYARTKYTGEKYTLTNPDALVIRTNIVGFRKNWPQPTFVEWAIETLKSKSEMTLFDDYYTSSISTTQFSKALFDVIEKNPAGIVNLASSQVSSKKEFIETLAFAFGFSLENTKTGKVSTLTSSKRADSLGLDVSKAEEILGYKLPNLIEVVNQLKLEYEHV